MPRRELDLFDVLIQRASDLAGMATSFDSNMTAVLDFSDMYRAAYVQGVSALDAFIHAEVRLRILEIVASGRSKPPALERFRLPLSRVHYVLTDATQFAQLNWLDSEIREQHSYLSFQHPDKIADAVRLVVEVDLWKEVATCLGQAPVGGEAGAKIVKRQLALIVDRRNTIVHEADLDPVAPGREQYQMTRDMALEAINFLQRVAHAIFSLL